MAEDAGRDFRERLLDKIKRNKRNRELPEIEALLRWYGFRERRAMKELAVWKRGIFTLTLPHPKDRVLKVPYVALVVRMIELAEGAGEPEEEGP